LTFRGQSRSIAAQSKEKTEPKEHKIRKLKTTSDTKTEKPLVYFMKTENQMLENEKSANHNENEIRKTEVFGHENQKTDLKTSQNCKIFVQLATSVTSLSFLRKQPLSSSQVI